jgi:hypothetical protein
MAVDEELVGTVLKVALTLRGFTKLVEICCVISGSVRRNWT